MNQGQLKFWLKVLVSAAILFFIFGKIEFSQVWLELKKTHPGFLFLALASFILSQWVSSIRLGLFWRCLKIPLGRTANWRLYLLGMYYNLLLPGGIGGDGYKLISLNQDYGTKRKDLFLALLFDRLLGLLALFLLAALGMSWYFPSPWSLIPVAVILLIPLAYFILQKTKVDFLPAFPLGLSWSLLIQGLQILSAWFILQALGLEENVLIYLILFLLSSLAAVIPITLGGAGARELTFVFAGSYFAIDVNAAIALSLMFYLLTLGVSLAGMYYSFKSYK
ncbi:MAG: flippase-like domain-containing protein [Saprospiraceae bacterium]|nr:flippase-like domain-containing protein [Saprospiraceae bacterium]